MACLVGPSGFSGAHPWVDTEKFIMVSHPLKTDGRFQVIDLGLGHLAQAGDGEKMVKKIHQVANRGPLGCTRQAMRIPETGF